MAGRIGQRMRSGQPDVIGGQPGKTYWDQRRAWDREVKEGMEGFLTAPTGTLLADLDAGAFQCNEPRQANGCTLSFSVGWVNGAAAGTTNSQRLTAPLLLPIGTVFSSIVFNGFGDAVVVITCQLKTRSATGVLTTISSKASALVAVEQRILLSFAPQTIGMSPSGTYFLDVTMPPNAAQSLRLWSAQVFA